MLFKLENGLLVLDKDELRAHEKFKRILERDRGSEGDNDGRKKIFAFKEFFYIYSVADFRSDGNIGGFNAKDLHLRGVKDACLPENWKPDDKIKEAIDFYKERLEEISPSYTYILKLIRGQRLSEKVVENLLIVIEKLLEMNEKAMKEEIPNIAEIIINNKALQDQIKQLNSLAVSFPDMLETLEETRKKIVKEVANARTGRGGKNIPNRADPK